MTRYPEELYYTKDHEWLRVEGDTGTVGITDHAQTQLGDVVYVELPEVGAAFETGAAFGSVESVKAVSELYLPVAGEIVEANSELADAPDRINEDPHGAGWMVRVRLRDLGDLSSLMRAADYEQYVKEEGGH
jgi:glycine cleavage system H protein